MKWHRRSSGEGLVGNWQHLGVKGELLEVEMGGGRVKMGENGLQRKNRGTQPEPSGPAVGSFLVADGMAGGSFRRVAGCSGMV